MATDIKQPLTKDLLQREHVRTMKKDLASLREADSLEEKKKISKIKIVPQEPVKREPVQIIAEPKQVFQSQPIAKPAPKIETTDQLPPDLAKAKEYANETEKQQIFLFQSEKIDLERQLTSPDFSQKDKMLSQRKDWEEKLDLLRQEKGMQAEEEKQNTEKKIWSIESNIAAIDKAVDSLGQESQLSGEKENNIKAKIADINSSLKTIYNNILAREEALKKPPVQKPQVQPQTPRPPINNTAPEPEFLKQVTPVAREKLVVSTQVEEKQRAKFMEDVEKWVALSENKNNQ